MPADRTDSSLFPFGWIHALIYGHRPDFRWYDVGWARIRGCETCEIKKSARYRDA